MPNNVVNYDGSIVFSPAQLVSPTTVEEIQAVLRDPAKYPGPVRAMGTYHSLTPCASTAGTVVNMTRMTKIISIDAQRLIFTAQGGLEVLDAAKALRPHGLQLMTNIEIGNMSLGSAACCHSKDALDGIEFGQFNSYVTEIKWVAPDGSLQSASEMNDPELLRKVRSSYGLIGIVYEVTLRVKPIEALHFMYLPRPVDELTEAEVDQLMDTSEGLIGWTVQRTCIFQQRHQVQSAGIVGALCADVRRNLWSYTGAHAGQFIGRFFSDAAVRNAVQTGGFDAEKLLYAGLHLAGGFTLLAPDKIIDYNETPPSARYAFTFWAFPRSQWLAALRAYLDFAEAHFKRTGFRCNLPLGSYHIRRDKNSLLSHTFEDEIFSLDPIHAVTDLAAWQRFLREFNEFAFERGGIPLLNQSPFVERKHMEQAYGQRWSEFSAWVRTMDPQGRMLSPFFAELLTPA
jgi:FAD/FMN-containing dehydrogenase